MLKRVLDFLNIGDEDGTTENCSCCTNYLVNNSCICKEEIDLGDGITYFTRGECEDWDCSRCH